MGLILANEATFPALHRLWTDIGVTASPDDCFLALRGFRTCRAPRATSQESALTIARWLKTRPEVREVIYPALPGSRGHELWKRDFIGASGLFAVVLQPVAKARIDAMLDGMRLFGMGWSWGGFESLMIPIYPERVQTATTWDAGGPCLRLAIGLEDPDDLIADLDAGFARLARRAARCALESLNGDSALVAEVDRLHFGIGPNRLRRALGDDAAVIEHDDAIGVTEHDIHVVLGEEDRDPLRARELGGELHQPAARARRHAGGRLVHQQERGVARERQRELDALRVAIGERRACPGRRSAPSARARAARRASRASNRSPARRCRRPHPRARAARAAHFRARSSTRTSRRPGTCGPRPSARCPRRQSIDARARRA